MSKIYLNIEYKYPSKSSSSKNKVRLEFKADYGEKVFLTGRTGSGKSTLLRILNGLIPEMYGGDFRGKVSIYGRQGNNKDVFLITQYPEEQIICDNVLEEVAFPLIQRGFEWREAIERAEEILTKLRLNDLIDMKTFELSDGQKQAVIICSGIVCDCKCIAIDEMAHLHPSIVKEVTSYLLKDDRTFILSEHRTQLSEGFDRIFWLEGGSLKLDPVLDYNLYEKKEGKILVHARDAVVYRCGKKVLDCLNFKVREGEIVALVGVNGAGKTSLLRAVAGFEKSKGIEVNGKVGFSFQYPSYSLNADRVIDEVDIRYLHYFNLINISLRHPHSLSGGEKRMVSSLKALKSKIVLLDEPTAGLDEKLRFAFMSRIIKIAREEGKAVLISTHDENIAEMCDFVLELTPNEN